VIWGAVIVAAGRGTRFGSPKQLVELAGKPMVAWSIEMFASMPEIVDLVVVTEAEFVVPMQAIVDAHAGGSLGAHVTVGGATRQESVHRGLSSVAEHCEGVLVHDGARPLVTVAEVRAGMAAVRSGRGALLATPVVDTIKVVDGDHKVIQTLDRRTLWAAQTPQFATRADLVHAHAVGARNGARDATDDAALLEAIGCEMHLVEASPENFKVTVAHDRARAEALLRARTAHA
jgi:2-C-methyl-D-erythritol 4-phosphate cytidylyltransferase